MIKSLQDMLRQAASAAPSPGASPGASSGALPGMSSAAAAGATPESPPRPGGTGRQARKGPGLFTRMAALYSGMEEAYAASAQAAGLSCQGCETNCCTSFFKHHTYVEWAYLWRGLSILPGKERKAFVRRAGGYLEEARRAIAAGVMPTAMCPLNEGGLCVLYPYRLMICRMHGTRNVFTLPDGARQLFPGCARFTAMHGPLGAEVALSVSASDAPGKDVTQNEQGPAPLDRTPFYTELAALEQEFRQRSPRPLPRLSMTLAEMIVSGPPRLV